MLTTVLSITCTDRTPFIVIETIAEQPSARPFDPYTLENAGTPLGDHPLLARAESFVA